MIGKKLLALGLIGSAIFLAASPLASAADRYQAGRIIVKFRTTVNFQADNTTGFKSLDDLASRFSVTAVRPLWPAGAVLAGARDQAKLAAAAATLQKYYLIQFDPKFPVEEVLSAYRRLALIDRADPDHLASAQLLPDDPDLYRQWGLRNTGQEYKPGRRGAAGADIQAASAWDRNIGNRDIIVAVIDSGVQADHPDLAANVWHNPGEIPANGIDDDNNGFIDDYYGWNFVQRPDSGGRLVGYNNNTADDNGHGTAMSGVIGAVGNNGRGTCGVNWQTTLMPVKVLDNNGLGTTFEIASGIVYAVSNGAKVLNLSLGGPDETAVESDAVAFAVSAGCFLAAAAGNLGTPQVFYPAGYDGVTGVGATDDEDDHAAFSNFNDAVDLSAPGVSIYATFPGSTYDYCTGTSPATAFVAGAAAWLLGDYSILTGPDVEAVLEDFAVDLGAAGWDPFFGWGRLMMNINIPTPYSLKVTISDIDTGNTTYTNAYEVGVGLHYVGEPVEILLSTKADGSDGAWQDFEDFIGNPVYVFPSLPPNKTPEGKVYLFVRLKSDDGDVGNVRSGFIILDLTPPELSQGVAFDDIPEVKSGDLIPPRPLLTFSLRDETSGLREQGVFVSVDSQPFGCDSYNAATGQFTFRLVTPLSVGGHNIILGGLYDRAGNRLPDIELKDLRAANAAETAAFDTGVKPFGWYDPTTDLIYLGYSLTADAACRIRVFDQAGNTLWQCSYPAGSEGGHFGYNQVSWDGNWGGHRLSYGVYPFVVSLESGGRYATGSLVFVPR